MAITAQDTYDVFIGSGALAYAWYQEIADETTPLSVGDDWSISFQEFGDDGPNGQRTITHKDVMRTVRRIASKDGASLVGPHARKQCQALVFKGTDEVDFDSDLADQVIQLAAFGEVRY